VTQLPLIHLNGTDGHTLAEEYCDALEAIDKAIDALRALTVHARDYYPLGSLAAGMAFEEHGARLDKLETIRAELSLVYASIFEQLSEREERAPYTGVSG
jgi:hypothetical protein